MLVVVKDPGAIYILLDPTDVSDINSWKRTTSVSDGLQQVTEFPAVAENGMIVEYMGPTNADLTHGFFYQFNGTEWEIFVPVKSSGSSDGLCYITVSKTGYVTTVRAEDSRGVTTTYITDGRDGVDGVDGITPTVAIGANGNWIINSIDTGVHAQGAKGDKGDGFSIDKKYATTADMVADTVGDSDEEKIVLFADKNITIPKNYTLTPASPKKSLVIYCDTLTNNGTISMYQKAPYVLPHDYFIIGKNDGYTEDIIIPAYANNAKVNEILNNSNAIVYSEHNGVNGTNRQCGSGGLGSSAVRSGGPTYLPAYGTKSGSGYAFGGGAGSGGVRTEGKLLQAETTEWENASANSIYPMKGGNATKSTSLYYCSGGVGNPKGSNTTAGGYGSYIENAFGCGGRIIIFCNNFNNNGTITVDGTTQTGLNGTNYNSIGGSSGAGAIDLFYRQIIKEGTLTANGGQGGSDTSSSADQKQRTHYVGAGGNGSITFSELQSNILMKPLVKYFSQANVAYLLTELSDRIKDSRMGE